MMKKSFYSIEKTTKICSEVSNLEVGVLLYYALLILIAKLSTLLLKTCPYQLLGSEIVSFSRGLDICFNQAQSGYTKGGSITVPLTSYLTGLEAAV